MRPFPRSLARWLALACACLALAAPARAQAPEKRIALVVGNSAYAAGALPTTANDAGLVAQTLQAAGFDVVGARDLDEAALRQALRDFLDKAASSGPETVAFVYLAGYGLQVEGENYFAPVDARIGAASDVPVATLRVSDYAKRLAALPLKTRFLVLDAGRRNPFVRSGEPLAGGLALVEAEPGSLVAFNAAPGTVGPDEGGPYGAYAKALVEMVREGGLPPAALFERVRLRVAETTKGGLVPWDAARIEAPFQFFQRAADAPPAARPEQVAALRERPLREIGSRDAYALCLQRDTLPGYQDFVAAYPADPLAARVRAIIAARREAVTWRRTWLANTPDAYWTYLTRYPRGPHAWESRRRLAALSAALQPPPRFTAFAYDVPPPPPEEIVYVERPALYFDDPVYAFAPPPPPPVIFLEPRPAYIVDLAPPPPPVGVYLLPTPAFVAVPAYVSAPAYVAAPPNAVLYEHIHDRTVIESLNAQNAAPRTGPSAGAIGAGALVGAAAGIAAARVALPPSLARRAGGGPDPGLAGKPPVPAAMPGQIPMGPGLTGQQAGRPPMQPPGQRPLPGQGKEPLPQNGLPVPNANAARPGAGQPAAALPGAHQAAPLMQARPGQMPAPNPAAQVQPAGRPGGAPAPGGPRPGVDRAAQRRPAPPQQDPRVQQMQAARAEQQRQQAAQRGVMQAGPMQRQQQMQARQMQAVRSQEIMRAQQVQQQSAQRQMMMQQRQQAVQQQQMQRQPMMAHPQMQPQRPPPPQQHGGGGGGHCPPGKPCR